MAYGSIIVIVVIIIINSLSPITAAHVCMSLHPLDYG